jgi:hypothetical protein
MNVSKAKGSLLKIKSLRGDHLQQEARIGLLLPFMALWSIGPGFLIILGAMENVPNEI